MPVIMTAQPLAAPARSANVWWLSPVGAVCLLTLPTLALAAGTSDARFRFAWGSPKALTSRTAFLLLCGAVVFMLSAALPLLRPSTKMRTAWPNFSSDQNRLLARAAATLFWLTMTGYAAFAISLYLNGLTLSAVLQALIGQSNYSGGSIKSSFVNSKIPGVTTLTQVAVAFVVVAMLVLVQKRDLRLRRRLVFTCVCALLRASLGSERLAILELLMPMAAIYSFRQVSVCGPRGRSLVLMAPAILIPAVLVVFGAFEYSRSWTYYRTRTTSSYAQFTVERFAGYYATAYNNGQLALLHETYPGRIPYDTIEALWTFPGAKLFGGYPAPRRVYPVNEHALDLKLHGNPEFNSPGGLATPFVDCGTRGGFVFLALAGGTLGVLYRRCTEGNTFAVVLFPAMTTGLFELPRYVYWSLGRFTPSLIALCVLAYLLRKQNADLPAKELPHSLDERMVIPQNT